MLGAPASTVASASSDDAGGSRALDPYAGPLRELTITCYRQQRRIGCFRPALHTDIRTVVEALVREVTGRGRPITLAAERLAAVEVALQQDGTHASLSALRSSVRSWHAASRESADASGVNRYYDEWRVQGYTTALEAPQSALALRCLELSGVNTSGMPLLLDLGCGSGLSCSPLESRGCRVLGLDLSLEMLREARRRGCEVVQADMSRPLPLRSGAFDAVLSVAALQFLCEPADGRAAPERLRTCVRGSVLALP